MHWAFWTQLAALCTVNILDFASSQNLYFNGRFPQQKSNQPAFPVRLAWASSSVYVPFQGSGSVTVSLSSTSATGSSQIELRIDSKLVESATVNSTSPLTVSVPILGSGSHLLVVTKITEALFGEATLNNVHLDGPSFEDRGKALSNRRMEIIGGSVVNGFGNLGQSLGCDPIFRSEDSVLAFGPLAANHFGARFSQIAWAGAGVWPWNSGKGTPTIPQLYNRTFPLEAASTWDFASFVPQVVVVDAGGHDFNSGSAAPGWADAYRAFLQQIRSNAPEADVIVMGLPDNVLAGFKSSAARQYFFGNVTAVLADLRDAGFERLHRLAVPSSVMTNGFGCLGHPSTDTHAAIAEFLQDFIGNLTGWTPVSAQGSSAFIFNN
ncbi:probable acetylxylan esterase / glucomannan deacetylase [Coccomyxa sp. Obi]|nr:probable acetylxylan esterase / glucomannan deacetylase [Coccomyxa sp. Obi]